MMRRRGAFGLRAIHGKAGFRQNGGPDFGKMEAQISAKWRQGVRGND